MVFLGLSGWAAASGAVAEGLRGADGATATTAPVRAPTSDGAVDTGADGVEGCPAWPDLGAAVAADVSVDPADVGIWVVDLDGGCTSGTNPDTPMAAASTIKLLALAGVLERAQREGRDLSDDERALVVPMIEVSDNDAATALIDDLEAGDDASPGESFGDLGARWGVPGAQNPRWGLSQVTARQMADLVGRLFDGSRLAPAYEAEAKALLDLPADDFAAGWRVAVGYDLPEGWYQGSKTGELVTEPDGLNVHGVGLVESPDGHRWAVAVLARGWADYDDDTTAYAELDEVGGLISCALSSDDPTTCR